jgi:hypothetical protein
VAFRNPLTSLPASAITGQIPATQISGKLTADQIASVTAGQVVGQFTSSQIASVSAAAISGLLKGTQLAADSIDGKTINGAVMNAGTFRTTPTSSGMHWELNSTNYDKIAGYTGDVKEVGFGGLVLYADSVGLKTGIISPVLSSNDPAGLLLTALRSPAGNTQADLNADTVNINAPTINLNASVAIKTMSGLNVPGVYTGSTAVPIVAAAPAAGGVTGVNVAATIPAGFFTSAPRVFLNPPSGRLIAVATSITTTGFNINLNNVTTNASAAGTCTWVAIAG